MDSILNTLSSLLFAGWSSLLDYLAAHVLLCLVPAFIIAGFMSSMIPKETITRYLGPKASKWISYPASAFGGFILAVCSCTILPLFAGIWKRGAGLGPAITFLFVGPAINILAITYTGAAIGFDIAVARLVLSIAFGIVIGLAMAWIFRKEETARTLQMTEAGMFEQSAQVKPAIWVVFLLLVAVLIVGTLQIDLLTNVYAQIRLPFEINPQLRDSLSAVNLTFQGALLIILLVFIGLTAWKGFENVFSGFNRWTYVAIGLIAFTIIVASPKEEIGSIIIGINGRLIGEALVLTALGAVISRSFTKDELSGWIWETWKFVKQIFPLLIVGVFLAGIAKEIIPAVWVQTIAGRNTLFANLVGVLFGVFMYFPTLVEVPVARMFLDLGMARGPLLAYLLADPELSLQSILVLNGVMGRKKTAVYVSLVALMSTSAGYLFGLLLAAS
ncbi:predicted permeases [Bellilinea caldifistulae]|uniref:Permease n=1 Tax=Bellilinea caldifistulae TaxID=360411 RepID=A0A0P6XQA7_9CHLR|nr:permease [Bellilinea caldifistulae]KPL74452.1 permease [Bellilinea caldifistulae]GAP11632.1 predicted permeases [Bellilinea caldifistulae]